MATDQQKAQAEEAGRAAVLQARFDTLREYGESVLDETATDDSVNRLLTLFDHARCCAQTAKIPPTSIVRNLLSMPAFAIPIQSLSPPYMHRHLRTFACSDATNEDKILFLRGCISAILQETIHAAGGEDVWNAYVRGFNDVLEEGPPMAAQPPPLSFM